MKQQQTTTKNNINWYRLHYYKRKPNKQIEHNTNNNQNPHKYTDTD